MTEQDNLAAVAKQLHQLADDLAAGFVKVGGVVIPVVGAVKIKVKQKVTRDRVKLDVSLVGLLAEEKGSISASSEPVLSRQGSGRAIGQNRRPYEAKKQKKLINSLWKEVVSAVARGRQPDQASTRQLLDICEEYGLAADSRWATQWQQCLTEIKACLAAIKVADFTQARLLVEEVKKLTKQCHGLYK